MWFSTKKPDVQWLKEIRKGIIFNFCKRKNNKKKKCFKNCKIYWEYETQGVQRGIIFINENFSFYFQLITNENERMIKFWGLKMGKVLL